MVSESDSCSTVRRQYKEARNERMRYWAPPPHDGRARAERAKPLERPYRALFRPVAVRAQAWFTPCSGDSVVCSM